MIGYLGFMIPSSGIEWLFFIVIFGLSIGNLALLPFFANKRNWDNRWQAGTFGEGNENDDFDIAHGSIFELSSAVATWPERCAEVLPSLLLVIGLLGTFLGVGFALDSAAGVLGNKEGDPSKLISEMLPMLEGLGALFKSSIYGIICFLAFSLIRNALGYDKKRLTWCITHCYEEIRNEKKRKADVAVLLEGMSTNLENMSESIGSSLEVRLNRVFKELTTNFSDTFNALSSDNKRVLELTKEVVTASSNAAGAMESMAQKAHTEFEGMSKAAISVCENSGKLAEVVQSAVPMFQSATESMSNGFKNLAENQIPQIVTQLAENQEKQVQVLKNGCDDLLKNAQAASQAQTAALQEMNKSVSSLDQRFAPILEQIKKTEEQIKKMNENVSDMQNVVKEALKEADSEKVAGKVAEHFVEMKKFLAMLQQDSLKEQRNILAKMSSKVKSAQEDAGAKAEKDRAIGDIVQTVLNPGKILNSLNTRI